MPELTALRPSSASGSGSIPRCRTTIRSGSREITPLGMMRRVETFFNTRGQVMAFEMERSALVAFLQDLVSRAGDKKPTDKAFANIDASIEYRGSKIVLPADPRNMTLAEARDWLSRLE